VVEALASLLTCSSTTKLLESKSSLSDIALHFLLSQDNMLVNSTVTDSYSEGNQTDREAHRIAQMFNDLMQSLGSSNQTKDDNLAQEQHNWQMITSLANLLEKDSIADAVQADATALQSVEKLSSFLTCVTDAANNEASLHAVDDTDLDEFGAGDTRAPTGAPTEACPSRRRHHSRRRSKCGEPSYPSKYCYLDGEPPQCFNTDSSGGRRDNSETGAGEERLEDILTSLGLHSMRGTVNSEIEQTQVQTVPQMLTGLVLALTPYNKYNTSNTDAVLTNEIGAKELDGNSPELHLLTAALLVKARVFELANSAGACKLTMSSYT
jgi:hypothetical protein